MTDPLVSIIVPAYNAAKFLPETIESVLKQTYANWEMLIVDDGSADNTLMIARQYAAKDQRIKVIPLGVNHGGPAAPRNCGMRQAKGQYIAFLDADDIWLPEKLQKQVRFLEDNPDTFLLHSQCVVTKDDVVLGTLPKKSKSGYIFTDLFLHFNFINCLTVIMRNNAARLYFFDEDKNISAVEDYAMWLSIARYERISFMKESLAVYRIHPKGISSGAFLNFKKCVFVLRKFRFFVSRRILCIAYFNFYLNLLLVGAMTFLSTVKRIILRIILGAKK